MKKLDFGHFYFYFFMNDNNENMSMLTFITKVYEICYYVQGIYTNCTRYMNLMYKVLWKRLDYY